MSPYAAIPTDGVDIAGIAVAVSLSLSSAAAAALCSISNTCVRTKGFFVREPGLDDSVRGPKDCLLPPLRRLSRRSALRARRAARACRRRRANAMRASARLRCATAIFDISRELGEAGDAAPKVVPKKAPRVDPGAKSAFAPGVAYALVICICCIC